jgi:hypothetical protein
VGVLYRVNYCRQYSYTLALEEFHVAPHPDGWVVHVAGFEEAPLYVGPWYETALAIAEARARIWYGLVVLHQADGSVRRKYQPS